MRVILFGPPGCGKGTQGTLIEKKYGFCRISTGDLLRSEVHQGTPLGKEAELKMSRGELVSDDIVIEMIRNRVFRPEYQRGYVLDGYPRNLAQAQSLENIDPGRDETAIEIHLSDQAVFDRLGVRRVCMSCETIYNLSDKPPKKADVCDGCGEGLVLRDDDKPEVIKSRLKVYHQQTKALIDYYSRKKVYFRVAGEGQIETVFNRICSVLDRQMAKFREVEIRK